MILAAEEPVLKRPPFNPLPSFIELIRFFADTAYESLYDFGKRNASVTHLSQRLVLATL